MNEENPLVSVCIFSYNYEQYILQAVESVLNQKTNFRFEIVIGDDLSTDRTRELILQINEKSPGRIRLSFNEKNTGGTRNWIKTIGQCRGKYIALLDGDDYFTDPYKLQKQADAMEQDQACMLTFHAIEEVFEADKTRSKVVRFEKQRYELEDFLLRGWFIRTSTTMFRNGVLPAEPPAWVFDFPYRYDTIMHVFLGVHGHALYLDEVMSIWRKHEKGLSNTFQLDVVRNIQTEVNLANHLDQYTGFDYKKTIKKYRSKLYAYLLIHLIKSGLWLKHLWLTVTLFFKADIRLFFFTLIKKLKVG